MTENRSVFQDLRGIDVYLLDQLLKGTIDARSAILDAGCGEGRNIRFLISQGFDVWAVDRSADLVEGLRSFAQSIGKADYEKRYRVEALEDLSFPDSRFDVVICNAVLHFAADEQHFDVMITQLWRVLRPGGMLFSRLASSIGIEDRLQHIEGRRYYVPDGSERFLVDEEILLRTTRDLGAALLEPIKTVNVQSQRCMTTWVISKPLREAGKC